MSEWQPISTAPRDQTQKEMLLGYSPNLGIKLMRYDGWGRGSGGFETFKAAHDGYAIWGEFQPTHWMPLPEPPK